MRKPFVVSMFIMILAAMMILAANGDAVFDKEDEELGTGTDASGSNRLEGELLEEDVRARLEEPPSDSDAECTDDQGTLQEDQQHPDDPTTEDRQPVDGADDQGMQSDNNYVAEHHDEQSSPPQEPDHDDNDKTTCGDDSSSKVCSVDGNGKIPKGDNKGSTKKGEKVKKKDDLDFQVILDFLQVILMIAATVGFCHIAVKGLLRVMEAIDDYWFRWEDL